MAIMVIIYSIFGFMALTLVVNPNYPFLNASKNITCNSYIGSVPLLISWISMLHG